MSEERRRDNASEKGNGNPYYERALKREQEMTPEEKAKQEAWWAQVSKKFTIKGSDKQGE
ncbi:MAG: hypothetical protein HFG76_05340 [Hungatella sp.]|jgi:hypothetical protein|nr:hypothetical protein [Hungatella sp.]MCI9637023.1 hypothetical protein [Hungatella sp.]